MSVFDGLPAVFTGAFGRAVTIIPSGGSPYTVQAVVRRQSETELAGEFSSPTYETYISIDSALAASINDGDRVDNGSLSFLARHHEDDGRGMTRIWLERR